MNQIQALRLLLLYALDCEQCEFVAVAAIRKSRAAMLETATKWCLIAKYVYINFDLFSLSLSLSRPILIRINISKIQQLPKNVNGFACCHSSKNHSQQWQSHLNLERNLLFFSTLQTNELTFKWICTELFYLMLKCGDIFGRKSYCSIFVVARMLCLHFELNRLCARPLWLFENFKLLNHDEE